MAFGEGPPLKVSLGVASLVGMQVVNNLMAEVDARLYAAKAGGRDRVFVN